jgi:hypothetical protein
MLNYKSVLKPEFYFFLSIIVMIGLQVRQTERLLNIIIILSGVRLNPLGTAGTTGLLYQPQMIDDGYCGAIGGM